jgi:LemA protein
MEIAATTALLVLVQGYGYAWTHNLERRSRTLISFLIFLGIIAAIFFWGVSIYNRLVNERNRVRNGFAQIDVQLTRRHDLIPNLVEAVKGYMKHERETLEAVIQARNTAVSSLDAAKADPANADAMKKLGESEGALGGVLSRLFALSEAYPDLKANQNMMQFNKVAFSRQAFNDAVLGYNNSAENFPNNLIAGFFSFKLASFLEIDGEEKREAPEVSF